VRSGDRSPVLLAVALAVLFLEILAMVVGGGVAAFAHARDIGRADQALLGVGAFAVFGAALLAIPIGALRGRRRRRRWIEAVALQSILVFASLIALITSKSPALAVWPLLVTLAILVLLLAAPVSEEAPSGCD
jgi:peptidoglycan/LPS O-acetylase OafA/YrhL